MKLTIESTKIFTTNEDGCVNGRIWKVMLPSGKPARVVVSGVFVQQQDMSESVMNDLSELIEVPPNAEFFGSAMAQECNFVNKKDVH